jgi:hypothetical protein
VSLAGLTNQTISLQNPSGTHNKHGQPAYSSAVSVNSRFELTSKVIKTAERERDPINAIAIIGPGTVPQIGAKVTYGSTVYKVIAISSAPGASGVIHHYELMLQLWSFGV